MSQREADLVGIIQAVSADRARVQRNEWYMIWGLIAERGDHTLFGKPFRVKIEWPAGLPLHFDTEEQLRAHAREQIAKLEAQGL